MRGSITFVLVCFLGYLIPAITAVHRPRIRALAKRGDPKVFSQPIIQRQHHPRRDLLDLCISVDAGLLASVLQIIDPLAANLHLCLCLQDLNIFLDTDLGLLLGKLLGGKDNLATALKLLINTSPHAQHCAFPPHSRHACVIGKPCAFVCDPPYVQVGKTCVCPPPMVECNGRCGSFPNGCSSSVPYHAKKRTIGPVASLAEAQAFCKPNETVCGIPDREDQFDFECVDTRFALDSCGGCVTPHRLHIDSHPATMGKECGHLPGVVTASCSDSQCLISQCRDGWELDLNQSQCTDVSQRVANPSAGLRKRKEKRRDLLSTTNVVVDSADTPQLSSSTVDPSGSPPRPTSSLPSAQNDIAIIALDRLLDDLGLGSIKADIAAEYLVGGELADSLNNLLNSLGIGPMDVIPRSVDSLTTDVTTNVQVDPTLVTQIKALVKLVVILKDTSASTSFPVNIHNSPPIINESSVLGSNAPPLVDTSPINIIVQATIKLVKSRTLASLLNNLEALANINAQVNSTLAGYNCIENPGLARIVRDLKDVIQTTLDMKDWCEHNQAITAPGSSPYPGAPIPSSGGSADSSSGLAINVSTTNLYIPIDLGLTDLLAALGYVKGNVDTNAELQGLVHSLVNLVISLQGHSSSLPPVTATSDNSPTYSFTPSTISGAPVTPVNHDAVNLIVQATKNLIQSHTSAQLLTNVNVLLDVNSLIRAILGGCECVKSLGLEQLVKDLEDMLYVLLELKDWCHGTDGVGGTPHSNPIIIDASNLLRSLGLDGLLQVDGDIDGLGDGINGTVNSLLKSIGLGGVRRWLTRR